MKRALSAISLFLLMSATGVMADTGISIQSIKVPHHDRLMDMAVFYPGEGGTPSVLGENGVFYGVDVWQGAKAASGKYPVILLSHGWGGNYQRMAWLSKGLADKGAIVIAVNHPNSTTGELDNLNALDHWTRAQDLSAALDAVLVDSRFSGSVDKDRIYAAGFSYGGWTALSLGGLKGRRNGLEEFCGQNSQANSHCADILKAGIKIAEIDRSQWETSYKDTRIKAVAAVDPALTWGLQKSDTQSLEIPVLLIGLGDGKDRLHATDTSADGSGFESLFPSAKVERIVPAAHFTGLGICKPGGAEILADEKDDPVCTDPAGTDRLAVTSRIIDLISHHFKLD